jgi:hypothetical protein
VVRLVAADVLTSEADHAARAQRGQDGGHRERQVGEQVVGGGRRAALDERRGLQPRGVQAEALAADGPALLDDGALGGREVDLAGELTVGALGGPRAGGALVGAGDGLVDHRVDDAVGGLGGVGQGDLAPVDRIGLPGPRRGGDQCEDGEQDAA